MKFNYLYIFILTTASLYTYGQVFDNTQAHSRIKWKQINTQKFDLIFPEEFSDRAPKLAHQLDHFLVQMNDKFQRPTRKISFIIQQNHLNPNGFVMLAPRKSELYPTPSAIADNQEWLPNLALHEARHVVQFDNLTGSLQGAFFQQLALALFAIHIPAWYFEGDATLQETLYSDGGRGRLPSWNMPLRANLQSRRHYDFNKYVHGSYKDIVPSYYTIGYFLNSELYEIDENIHPKILDEMNNKLLRPFNFRKALKKHSGMNNEQLFASTMENLSKKWPANVDGTGSLRSTLDRYPTNYLLPQISDGQLYVLKESRQRTPAIIRMNPNNFNKQQTIVETGRQIMPYFHARGNLLVWDEYRRDPRFQKQTYNIINVHDLRTGKTRTLSSKTRYYTPVLSPDLTVVACVELDPNNRTNVVMLNTRTGAIEKRIPIPDDLHLQQPHFNATETKLVAIAVGPRGTNLIELDLETGGTTLLNDWSNIQYERPLYDGDAIIFKANQQGIDQIFKLDKGIFTQLTDSEFGAFNPFIAGDTLWFNDYQMDGFRVKNQQTNSEVRILPSLDKAQTIYPSQNAFKYATMDEETPSYEIEDYNVTANGFNFHSITMSGNDFESFNNFRPGIFWLSNDILNTTEAKLGYEYDTDLRTSIYSANLTYQRYIPKFSISYVNRGQRGQATRSDETKVDFDWREHYLTAEVQLPFAVYRRHYTYSYGFNAGTSLLRRYDVSMPGLRNFETAINFPLNYQVYLNRNRNLSMMDITPRWGQNISFTYRHIPFEASQSGSTWSLRTNFYFPGIWLNHGLQIRYSHQEKSGRYLHNDDIPLTRGYAFFPTEKLRNTLLMDYRLPLAYPDWSIGSLAYVKRVRADLHVDYQNIETSTLSPKTMGVGLSFDFNAFKYPLPLFTIGGRITYLNGRDASQRYVPTFSLGYSY